MGSQNFFQVLCCRMGTKCTQWRLLAALLGMALGTGWVSLLFWNSLVKSGMLRYADSNLPMLNTPDSYFFLYSTQDMLRLGITYDSESALSAVLALFHKIIWLPPEVTGFWLPFFVALACGLCFALWGALFRLPPLLVGLATLIGSLMPAWTGRVKIGTLDTDAGIFLLWGLCLWLAARLTLPRCNDNHASGSHTYDSHARAGSALHKSNALHERKTLWKNLCFSVAFLLCAALLGWFWKPGLLLVPLAVGLWGLTWNWSSGPWERRSRMVVAALLPVASLLLVFVSEDFLPAAVSAARTSLLTHMGVVLNPHDDVIFQSIAELGGLDLTAWLTGLAGSVPGGWLVLLAMLCMILCYPRESLLLVPSLLMAGLAFFSNRFQYFAMLPMGLAVAMLPLSVPELACRWMGKRIRPVAFSKEASQEGVFSKNAFSEDDFPADRATTPSWQQRVWEKMGSFLPLEIHWKRKPVQPKTQHGGSLLWRVPLKIAPLCLLALVLWSEGNHQWQDRGSVSLGRGEDQIVLALREAINAKPFGEAKALFHWWDEGYFLRYRTGVRTFFDGSTQTPLSAFLAAMPFVTDNPTLSRRWIRYFALHHGGNQEQEGWDLLVKTWGNAETALQELTTLFSLPDTDIDARLQSWPAMPGLSSEISPRDWLFPQGSVFVFLPVRFLTISPWWMSMGSSLQPGPVLQHMERFASTTVTYDPQSNQVSLPDEISAKGYTQAGGLFVSSPENPFTAPWGADRAEPLLLLAEHSPWGYLVNKPLARSIGFRLLAPSWENLPGFHLIAVNYGTAGAWEVLP